MKRPPRVRQRRPMPEEPREICAGKSCSFTRGTGTHDTNHPDVGSPGSCSFPQAPVRPHTSYRNSVGSSSFNHSGGRMTPAAILSPGSRSSRRESSPIAYPRGQDSARLIDRLLFQLKDELVDFGDGKKNEAVCMSQLIGGRGIPESLEQMHFNGYKILCL